MPENMSPFLALAMFLVLLALATIIAVGPVVWYWVVLRWWRGEPILKHEPRRLAPWGFIDGAIFIVLLVVLTSLFALVGKLALGLDLKTAQDADNPSYLYLVFLSTLAQMAACGLTAAIILLRTGCSVKDLGFSLVDLGYDIRIGAAAFCALAIPTYLFQTILTQFWKSEHPLIESLKTQPQPQFLAIAVFVAVVSAPLTEEFLFRGLFQGWLERMFDPWEAGKPRFFQTLLLGQPVRSEPEIIQAELAESAEDEVIYLGPLPSHGVESHNPYAPPLAGSLAGSLAASPQQPLFSQTITDILPISISASLFALAHFSHGPDWVPLFFFAVGLGYLYRRTHRITPSLVVHFLLNSLSMVALCLEILRAK
jgi:membrane protease YdiL (CAAX protease family)